MKTLLMVMVMAMTAGFASMAVAEKPEDAGKETTLTGTLTCAKCDLKQAEKCQNALIVKDGDKTTTYLLVPNQVSKDYHEHVCKGAKENISVTGKVIEEGGKHMIAASKIEAKAEEKKEG